MKTFIGIAAVVTIAVLSVTGSFFNDPISIAKHFDIIYPEVGPTHKSDLPTVFGVRSCGGDGEFITLRYKPCTSPNSICHIPSDEKQRAWEFEFIPSLDAKAVGLRINLLVDGSSKMVYDRLLPDSRLEAGKTFIFSSTGGFIKELKGKKITIQTMFYTASDNNLQACSEADYEVV